MAPIRGQEPETVRYAEGLQIHEWNTNTRGDSFLNPQQPAQKQDPWNRGVNIQGSARNWLGWAENARRLGSNDLAVRFYEEFLQERNTDGRLRIAYQNYVLDQLFRLYSNPKKKEEVIRERYIYSLAPGADPRDSQNCYAMYKNFVGGGQRADALLHELQPCLNIRPGDVVPE